MKKIVGLQEVQNIELGILKHMKEVCEKNELTYFLSGGTLLGAIRHHGFIPWDDDIDVMLPRKDYEKLIRIMRRDQSQYKMLSIYDKTYYYSYSRMVDTKTVQQAENHLPIVDFGVNIDVFPIDAIPQKSVSVYAYFRILRRLNQIHEGIRLTSKFNEPIGVAYRREVFLARCVSKIATCMVKVFNFERAQYVACSFGKNGTKEIVPAWAMKSSIQVDFENEKFNAPIGYEVYLRKLYGDYMKLPPKSQRKSDHSFKAFYK